MFAYERMLTLHLKKQGFLSNVRISKIIYEIPEK